jgi:multimeric flavodoxin WrbA
LLPAKPCRLPAGAFFDSTPPFCLLTVAIRQAILAALTPVGRYRVYGCFCLPTLIILLPVDERGTVVMAKVLGISSSPRIEGNSDLLLRQALAGAEAAGAQTEYVRLAELNIAPCIECNSCYKTGRCRIDDDYQTLCSKMLETDHLIFATPIFFMTVCAQAKLLIDRCQCLWAHKYVLKQPLIETAGRDRRAMVIAVGGTKSKKMFESVRLTFKYYLDVLDMQYAANLLRCSRVFV